MITVKVNTRDLDRLLRNITAFEKSLQDATPLWRQLLIDMREYESAIFANQGFGTWPHYTESFSDLAEAKRYMSFKESTVPGSSLTLLQLSGRLRDDLTKKGKLFMSSKQFSFGTDVEYAYIHNQGKNPVAKREFLSWNPQVSRIVKRDAEQFVKKRIGRFF